MHHKNIFFIFLSVLMLFSISASAHEPTLIIMKDGRHFYLNFNPDGPSITPVTNIIKQDEDSDKPDPPSQELQRQVTTWAKDLDDKINTQGIAMIYKKIIEARKSGSINDKNMVDAINEGTNQLLAATGGTERWRGFRDKVNVAVNEAIKTSPLVDVLEQVQKGLENSYE